MTRLELQTAVRSCRIHGFALPVTHGEPVTFNEILPGAGIGFRYMMIPEIRANVGVDIAVGREDWGLYFRIAEAF
jgi:hypothetical protein